MCVCVRPRASCWLYSFMSGICRPAVKHESTSWRGFYVFHSCSLHVVSSLLLTLKAVTPTEGHENNAVCEGWRARGCTVWNSCSISVLQTSNNKQDSLVRVCCWQVLYKKCKYLHYILFLIMKYKHCGQKFNSCTPHSYLMSCLMSCPV